MFEKYTNNQLTYSKFRFVSSVKEGVTLLIFAYGEENLASIRPNDDTVYLQI